MMMRNVFQHFPHMDVAGAIRGTVIKVIELDHLEHPIYRFLDLWRDMENARISISYLSQPCQLTAAPGKQATIKEIELRRLIMFGRW